MLLINAISCWIHVQILEYVQNVRNVMFLILFEFFLAMYVSTIQSYQRSPDDHSHSKDVNLLVSFVIPLDSSLQTDMLETSMLSNKHASIPNRNIPDSACFEGI